MTPSCSSVVMRFRRWDAPAKSLSCSWVTSCMIWLRASTSSPTRFISSSRSPTSTRIELSATPPPTTRCCAAASSTASWSALPCSTRISPIRRSSPRSCSCAASTTSCSELAPEATSISPMRRGSRPPDCKAVSRSRRTVTSRSPSAPVSSIARSIARRASPVDSSALAMSSVTRSSPSRSRPSRFSATCARPSSAWNPKKPLVPFTVWMVRKMLEMASPSLGSRSRARRSSS